MHSLRSFLKRLTTERLGWFGAGLSAACLGMVGYQLLAASVLVGGLPGPQPTPLAASAPGGTRPPFVTRTPTRTPAPTRTPFPTRTPLPTRTPFPTRTPTPVPTPTLGMPDVLATVTAADPSVIVGVVATFAARTNAALQPLLEATPERQCC